jgi:hypothetical protein
MGNSHFWDIAFPRVLSTYALLIFVILWVGFVFALTANPGWLDSIWDWVQALPIVVEIIVWLLFLPILVGIWIWESSWPGFLQLLGFAGIVGWTLLAVYSFIKYAR